MFVEPLIYAYSAQVYRTMGAALFSLKLSCEPPESLTLSKTRLKNERNSNPSPQHVETKVFNCLHCLTHEAGKKSSNACHIYKLNFDRRARHTRQLNVVDMLYVDNPPALKRHRILSSAREVSSTKLRSKESGPYRVARVSPYTVTTDIDGLHNVFAIDQVTLSQVFQELYHDANSRNCNNQRSLDHGTTLTKFSTRESVMERKASIVPEYDVLPPTAQCDAVRTKLREQRAPTGGEKQKQPPKYVVDPFIDSRVDC